MKNFSSLGIGTLHFGTLLSKKAAKEIVHRAIDQGINFFDTAPLYGNSLAEEILGEALFETKKPVFVCTKVGLQKVKRKDKQFGVEMAKLNATTLEQSVENSLKRLKEKILIFLCSMVLIQLLL